jgi:hypothetical protein
MGYVRSLEVEDDFTVLLNLRVFASWREILL